MEQQPEESGSEDRFRIFLVSDGSGETGAKLFHAAACFFETAPGLHFRIFSRQTCEAQLEQVLLEAMNASQPVLLIYSLVHPRLYGHFRQRLRELELTGLDLFQPLVSAIAKLTGATPFPLPVGLAEETEALYRSWDAVRFAAAHDDGQRIEELGEAELVLAAPSRVGKTPLSFFLAMKGIYTANVPILPRQGLPEALLELQPGKLIGLTMNPETLVRLRAERKALGEAAGDYDQAEAVIYELEQWEKLCRLRGWPMFEVGTRSTEELSRVILEWRAGRNRRS